MTNKDFWLAYLSAHQKRATRGLHYLATALVVLALILSLLTNTFWLIPIAIGLFAALTSFSHACIEHSPGLFRSHPVLGILACLRMSFCALTGDITTELEKAAPRHIPENW